MKQLLNGFILPMRTLTALSYSITLIAKHSEIICYHCQQAVEKYLKAFLCYNGVIPPKIHVLETLCALCSEFDSSFNNIARDCAYLSPFAVQARYPLEMEITNINIVKSLEIAQKVKDFTPITELKAKLINEKGDGNV